MAAENGEGRGEEEVHEGDEFEEREIQFLLYWSKVKVNNASGSFSLVHHDDSQVGGGPHLAAPLWVPYALNHCLILRAIAPVSSSRVSLVFGTAFSKHRQTIYQNAQNYILILV